MPSHALTHTTKELSKKTWPDFEKLFSQGNGWDFCWCIHFQRPRALPKDKRFLTRAERGARNRREKKELVENGRARGILVYAKGEPVGWRQYGPREELLRMDGKRNYREPAPPSTGKLWRITCFVVDKKYRRRGIATVALKAAKVIAPLWPLQRLDAKNCLTSTTLLVGPQLYPHLERERRKARNLCHSGPGIPSVAAFRLR